MIGQSFACDLYCHCTVNVRVVVAGFFAGGPGIGVGSAVFGSGAAARPAAGAAQRAGARGPGQQDEGRERRGDGGHRGAAAPGTAHCSQKLSLGGIGTRFFFKDRVFRCVERLVFIFVRRRIFCQLSVLTLFSLFNHDILFKRHWSSVLCKAVEIVSLQFGCAVKRRSCLVITDTCDLYRWFGVKQILQRLLTDVVIDDLY